MLLTIEVIQEIGRFSSLKHKAPQFGKLALIFARNGYGKSTLCSVFRSAAEQNVYLIAARRRLGAVKESRVQTQWQTDGAVTFSSGKWNACPGNLYIFDAEYVRRSLHVAESVTRENKRNLIPVVLGERGVELASAISGLDVEQRECATNQSALERVIKATCPVVTDVPAFADAVVPEDIDAKIAVAERALDLARHAMAVKEKKELSTVRMRTLAEFEEIAVRGLQEVSEHAAARVKTHIDAHLMHPNGERWLKYGVEHMLGDACPFCTQSTASVDLVSAFKVYFSAEYEALMADIESARAELQTLYGAEGELFFGLIKENRADLNFWKSVCEIETPPNVSESDAADIKQALCELGNLLESKIRDPLSSRVIGETRAKIEASLKILTNYQDDITKCNQIIREARDRVAQADITKAQEALGKWKALKAKLSAPLKDDVSSWQTHAKRRKEIEPEKKLAQESLKSYMGSTISSRQQSINDLLEMFGASFKIVNTKASFVGREASTDFSIEIDGHSVKAGEILKDAPCFNTVLSGGINLRWLLRFS